MSDMGLIDSHMYSISSMSAVVKLHAEGAGKLSLLMFPGSGLSRSITRESRLEPFNTSQSHKSLVDISR